ncbi:MAG: DUF962 domain-containing protein [Planctomycetaceae bacterium]
MPFQRFWKNYLQRHMHPVNRGLHLVGVPLTFVGTPCALIAQNYGLAAACFVGGYLLQFLGHGIEQNDAGEVILVKKWLNQPYTEFGPAGKESKFND